MEMDELRSYTKSPLILYNKIIFFCLITMYYFFQKHIFNGDLVLLRKKNQIRYGFGRRRNAVLPESHSETVRQKNAGIYGNLFRLITVNVLSAAQIYGKAGHLFCPQNVTGHQEREAGRLRTLNVSAALHQRCPNLVRKTLSFSRDGDLHRIRIRSFGDHYNSGLSA